MLGWAWGGGEGWGSENAPSAFEDTGAGPDFGDQPFAAG